MSPSLQPFCRLRSFPSGVTGPCDSRPLARLASARAAVECEELFVWTSSRLGERGGHRRLLCGGATRGVTCIKGPLRPGAYPGLVAGNMLF